MNRHFTDSASLCRYVRDQAGPVTILSFSAGKDAVCTWLRLRDFFDVIHPYYLYLVPGLEFIEEGLAYYERAFGVPIRRYPHPSLFRMLKQLVFQPPERAAVIERVPLPSLTYRHIETWVRCDAHLSSAFVAVGTRSADSPVRLASIRRFGALNPTRRTFQPVFDYRIADVERTIRHAGLRLPREYRWFGRSFDGFDYRFLAPIKHHAPRDYARILEWFPLAELELIRRQNMEIRHG